MVSDVTYGDWYLPSKHELNLLFLQKTIVCGFANDFYWTSTESNSDAAWGQFMDFGNQSGGAKFAIGCVRAVCAF